ncbi:hypothetical protein HYFRA_00009215 [Hymenoscyphus fraxineus]|uniref:H+/nucleoside cotransporter n=1 Tax=Hymenoscyphus fraxineus TaxID=746836 RepID=A0A9N9PP02_9HELO|nr:hypothetical protein HYFRA_00009215 [Hymenoscyphus fraxineus]
MSNMASNNAERDQENGLAINKTTDQTITPSPPKSDLPIYLDDKNTAAYSVDAKDVSTSSEKDIKRTSSIEEEPAVKKPSKIRQLYKRFRIFIHLAAWLLITAWWIVGLVLHRKDIGWLKPFLVYLAITIRLITLHISVKYVTKPFGMIIDYGVKKPVSMIPEKLQVPLGALGAIGVILLGTFVTEESTDNTRANRGVSLFGLVVFIFCFYITSNNRKMIKWKTVIVGMLAQFILALFVLRTKAGYDIFNFVAYLAATGLGFAGDGTKFLTGQAALDSHWFIVTVIPPIIFFVALVQLLYYWGLLQWAIKKIAFLFFHLMGVSGAEAVVAAASPFVGQGESAMLIKPFIPHLTDAELHQVMTSGFATIAGSVLAAYISMGISPLALVSSCVMSIPASLAISKLRWPETEESITAGKIVIPKDESEEKPSNSLHAFANGGWLGIKIGGMIIASLLCILALLGLCDALLGWFARYLSIRQLTIQKLIGWIFYPVAWLLGVQKQDVLAVGQLIGIKIVANEFVAFNTLSTDAAYLALSDRSRLIATYAVCGFGNISSVGIQIGVLSQLAPNRAGRIASVAFSALVSGVIATLTSASIAGMLISDSAGFIQVNPGQAA